MTGHRSVDAKVAEGDERTTKAKRFQRNSRDAREDKSRKELRGFHAIGSHWPLFLPQHSVRSTCPGFSHYVVTAFRPVR